MCILHVVAGDMTYNLGAFIAWHLDGNNKRGNISGVIFASRVATPLGFEVSNNDVKLPTRN